MQNSDPTSGSSASWRGSLVVLSGFLTLGLVLGGLWFGLGAKGVYFRYTIATLELGGLKHVEDAERYAEQFREMPAVHRVDLARSPVTHDRWLAKIAFRAETPTQAAQRIRCWMQEVLGSRAEARLVHATYFPCRVVRESGGDLVFGSPAAVNLQP